MFNRIGIGRTVTGWRNGGGGIIGATIPVGIVGMVGAGSEPAPTISIVPFISHRYTLRAFSSRVH
jgi:hypothetical protein